MKIAYIITGLELGGAETITVDLANRMHTRGNQVTLIFLTGENYFHERLDPGIAVTGLNIEKSPKGFIKTVIALYKIINKIKPDVVHSQMVHANLFARLVRIFVTIPLLICTEHTSNPGSKLRYFLYWLTDKLSDINTAVSENTLNYLVANKAFSFSKSIVVPNGINLSKFRYDELTRFEFRRKFGVAADEFLFLNVGRLNVAKDHFTLLKAFSCLDSGRLIIVGGGELHKKLVHFANNLGISHRVIFTGARSDVTDFYNASDCFVLSSAWEGFGLVLAEAMACGLPVITTNASGCAEVVSNENWVVPVEDWENLGQKMQEIMDMPQDQRNLIKDKNIKLSERFDIEMICDRWVELYSQRT